MSVHQLFAPHLPPASGEGEAPADRGPVPDRAGATTRIGEARVLAHGWLDGLDERRAAVQHTFESDGFDSLTAHALMQAHELGLATALIRGLLDEVAV